MTAEIVKMVDSQESIQTTRFQWRESATGYFVVDTTTGDSKFMGDGVDMFVPFDDDDEGLPDVPGTQRFYDSLNAYFLGEQEEIGKAYFDVELPGESRTSTSSSS